MPKASTAQTTAMIPPQANDDLIVAAADPDGAERQAFTKMDDEARVQWRRASSMILSKPQRGKGVGRIINAIKPPRAHDQHPEEAR